MKTSFEFATSPTLTIGNVQSGHFGTYSVIVTDVNGQSVTSAEAILSLGAGIVMPPGSDPAVPYPATITLSGLPASANKVTVTVKGLVHFFPDQLFIGIVGPTGKAVWLMTGAGGFTAVDGVMVEFDDTAATPIPDGEPLASGIYHTANYANATIPPEWGTPFPDLSAFNGINPNGIWSLYVYNEGGVPREICEFTVNVVYSP